MKPREFYDLVESLCPAPRYADLFSRYQHNDKWDCHGDQAPRGNGGAAMERGAAPSVASDIDLDIPTFLRRDGGGA